MYSRTVIALDEILPEDLPVAVQPVWISMGHRKICQGPVFAEVVGRGVQLALVYLVFIKGIGGDSAHTNNFFLFIAIMSVASFIIFYSTFLFARRYIKIGLRFDFAYWGKIIKTTWPIALSIVLTLIYFKIDTIFLSLMKPAADVGIYGVAYRVLEVLIFFPAIFSGIMMPLLSRNAVTDRVILNVIP